MATKEENNSNTLGVLGTTFGGVALADILTRGGLGGLLGGMPPGGPGGPVTRADVALATENAELKAKLYANEQTQPLAVTQARQGAEIECLRKQIELQAQITDGKINNVAQVAASGLQCLSQTVQLLQQSFRYAIPASNIIPSPVTASGATTTTGG